MDDIEKEANYYWQDKLAKFWPTMKGPSTVEVDMFRAGYKLATEGTHNCYDECTNPGCSLRRENDRLRAVLQSVMDNLGVPQPGYPAPVAHAYEIARAALEGKE